MQALAVDVEPAVHDALERALKLEGCGVSTAENGALRGPIGHQCLFPYVSACIRAGRQCQVEGVFTAWRCGIER